MGGGHPLVQTSDVSQAALIFWDTKQPPVIQANPFPTGNGVKISFLFPSLVESYRFSPRSETVSSLKVLLKIAEDYARLERCIQTAYREISR